MAYNELEPFGEERADLRMGILASVFSAPYLKPGASIPAPRDFMPDFDEEKTRQQSVLEMQARLKAAFGFKEDATGDDFDALFD